MKCNATLTDAYNGKTHVCEHEEHEAVNYPVVWTAMLDSEHNAIVATWHRVTFSEKPGDYFAWADGAEGATPHNPDADVSEPRWELESLRIRVPVPYWPLEPHLAERLTAGLSIWAAGVANTAGAMLDGPLRMDGRSAAAGIPGVVIFEVPVKQIPKGTD